MARIFLYSPVKPAKTGTANYFKLLIESMSEGYRKDHQITVAIDRKQYDSLPHVDGCRVVDYRKIDRRPDDVTIYFLANNNFHRYAHYSLHHHKRESGFCVAVVHEPANWMNIQGMCSLNQYGYTADDLYYFAKYEFGDDVKFMVDQFLSGEQESNFEYVSLASTHIFEKADCIIFHSYYARVKFLLEKSSTYMSNHRVRTLVMEHPPENNILLQSSRSSRKKFVIGTYGWVKKVKRINEIMLGFDRFYQSLDAFGRTHVELDVVGEIDNNEDFDPAALRQSLVSASCINLYGYVSDERLDKLMSKAALIFALRFPSCGETSGPVFKARSTNATLALSDYAAFNELIADYHISVDPKREVEEIEAVMQCEYQRFISHKPKPTNNAKAREYHDINQVLAKVLIMKDNSL